MNKRGQSILEYSVIFVVVASVIIVIVPLVFKPKVTEVYNKSADILDTGIDMLNKVGGQ